MKKTTINGVLNCNFAGMCTIFQEILPNNWFMVLTRLAVINVSGRPPLCLNLIIMAGGISYANSYTFFRYHKFLIITIPDDIDRAFFILLMVWKYYAQIVYWDNFLVLSC
jgi:hypothetical protein